MRKYFPEQTEVPQVYLPLGNLEMVNGHGVFEYAISGDTNGYFDINRDTLFLKKVPPIGNYNINIIVEDPLGRTGFDTVFTPYNLEVKEYSCLYSTVEEPGATTSTTSGPTDPTFICQGSELSTDKTPAIPPLYYGLNCANTTYRDRDEIGETFGNDSNHLAVFDSVTNRGVAAIEARAVNYTLCEADVVDGNTECSIAWALLDVTFELGAIPPSFDVLVYDGPTGCDLGRATIDTSKNINFKDGPSSTCSKNAATDGRYITQRYVLGGANRRYEGFATEIQAYDLYDSVVDNFRTLWAAINSQSTDSGQEVHTVDGKEYTYYPMPSYQDARGVRKYTRQNALNAHLPQRLSFLIIVRDYEDDQGNIRNFCGKKMETVRVDVGTANSSVISRPTTGSCPVGAVTTTAGPTTTVTPTQKLNKLTGAKQYNVKGGVYAHTTETENNSSLVFYKIYNNNPIRDGFFDGGDTATLWGCSNFIIGEHVGSEQTGTVGIRDESWSLNDSSDTPFMLQIQGRGGEGIDWVDLFNARIPYPDNSNVADDFEIGAFNLDPKSIFPPNTLDSPTILQKHSFVGPNDDRGRFNLAGNWITYVVGQPAISNDEPLVEIRFRYTHPLYIAGDWTYYGVNDFPQNYLCWPEGGVQSTTTTSTTTTSTTTTSTTTTQEPEFLDPNFTFSITNETVRITESEYKLLLGSQFGAVISSLNGQVRNWGGQGGSDVNGVWTGSLPTSPYMPLECTQQGELGYDQSAGRIIPFDISSFNGDFVNRGLEFVFDPPIPVNATVQGKQYRLALRFVKQDINWGAPPRADEFINLSPGDSEHSHNANYNLLDGRYFLDRYHDVAVTARLQVADIGSDRYTDIAGSTLVQSSLTKYFTKQCQTGPAVPTTTTTTTTSTTTSTTTTTTAAPLRSYYNSNLKWASQGDDSTYSVVNRDGPYPSFTRDNAGNPNKNYSHRDYTILDFEFDSTNILDFTLSKQTGDLSQYTYSAFIVGNRPPIENQEYYEYNQLHIGAVQDFTASTGHLYVMGWNAPGYEGSLHNYDTVTPHGPKKIEYVNSRREYPAPYLLKSSRNYIYGSNEKELDNISSSGKWFSVDSYNDTIIALFAEPPRFSKNPISQARSLSNCTREIVCHRDLPTAQRLTAHGIGNVGPDFVNRKRVLAGRMYIAGRIGGCGYDTYGNSQSVNFVKNSIYGYHTCNLTYRVNLGVFTQVSGQNWIKGHSRETDCFGIDDNNDLYRWGYFHSLRSSDLPDDSNQTGNMEGINYAHSTHPVLVTGNVVDIQDNFIIDTEGDLYVLIHKNPDINVEEEPALVRRGLNLIHFAENANYRQGAAGAKKHQPQYAVDISGRMVRILDEGISFIVNSSYQDIPPNNSRGRWRTSRNPEHVSVDIVNSGIVSSGSAKFSFDSSDQSQGNLFRRSYDAEWKYVDVHKNAIGQSSGWMDVYASTMSRPHRVAAVLGRRRDDFRLSTQRMPRINYYEKDYKEYYRPNFMQSSGYLFVSGEINGHLGLYNYQNGLQRDFYYSSDYYEFNAQDSMMLMPLAMDFNSQHDAANNYQSLARDQNIFPGYNGMQEYKKLYHEHDGLFRINQFGTAGDSLVENIYHYNRGQSILFSSGIRR